jgi:hypothetical protein
MKVRIKFKKIIRQKGKKKWDRAKLKKDLNRGAYQKEIEDKLKDRDRSSKNVEERWQVLKEAVIESAEKNVGHQNIQTARKPWVTDAMISKMEERRKWKNIRNKEGNSTYKKFSNELRRETDRARKEWWKRTCDELEELDRGDRSDLMYRRIKTLTGQDKIKNRNEGIKDEQGELMSEPEEIKNRWKRYIEVLYDKDGKPSEADFQMEEESLVDPDALGPDLMESEVTEAIKEMKNNKAEGIDGIPGEFWKNLGQEGMKVLIDLCRKIYVTGIWPSDFTKAVMVPLPKKVNAVECNDYRTISLIPHASKILLKIIMKRIEGKAINVIGKTQFGFRKGMGTREAIGTMRMLCERSLEYGNDVYICFVDFEKAFDRVNWVKMMEILKRIGVDWRDRRLVTRLYMNQEAVVRVNGDLSAPGKIGRGVRQECLLSRLLFSLYVEMMMQWRRLIRE